MTLTKKKKLKKIKELYFIGICDDTRQKGTWQTTKIFSQENNLSLWEKKHCTDIFVQACSFIV